MHKPLTTTKAAMLGGVAALALALPLTAAQADEPVVLDAMQLDSVTAAAAAGLLLFGDAEAFGTLSSQSWTLFQAQSSSSPAFSTASGSVTSFGMGIGGTGANTPSATASSEPPVVVGDRTYVYTYNRSGAGAGYAWAYDTVYVFAVSSEFPL